MLVGKVNLKREGYCRNVYTSIFKTGEIFVSHISGNEYSDVNTNIKIAPFRDGLRQKKHALQHQFAAR